MSLLAVSDVTGDEGRSLLHRELRHPDYHQESTVERIFDWIMGLGDALMSTASSVPGATGIAASVVFLVLLLLLALSLGRIRRNNRASSTAATAVLDETVSASEWVAAAQQAHRAGDLRVAAIASFRAAATRQVERGLIAHAPGATARNVAEAASAHDPLLGTELSHGAAIFEVALYSDLDLDPQQVERLLALARGERVPAWSSAATPEVPQ